MTLKNFSSVKVLLIYMVIGMAAAAIVMYFQENPVQLSSSTVEFSEISPEDARELAEDYAEVGKNVVSYSGAVQEAAPAVVNIYTSKRVPRGRTPMEDDPLFQFFFKDQMPPINRKPETSLGSGVIVSEKGYILTNNHVIENADEILVALRDGRNAEAKVVGTDPESDLAVLQIRLNNLPQITLGHSELLSIGDVVLAIGNPFGVGQTVTMGIVSATGRDRLGLSTFENFIQTDAAINPGNSGGALINPFGHLVGINTAIYSQSGGSQGIGFAIPIDVVKQVMGQIIEKGHAVRGWIGIEIQNMTPSLAESFGLDEVRGIIIAGVLRQGPADQAGLQPGDIILDVSETPVRDTTQALKEIARHEPGSKVNMLILRDGKERQTTVTTAERPVPKRR